MKKGCIRISDKENERIFGIHVQQRKRGGDHRNPSTIQHFAVIDSDTGEIIDHDCTSLKDVAMAIGYSEKSSKTVSIMKKVKAFIDEGLAVRDNMKYTIVRI